MAREKGGAQLVMPFGQPGVVLVHNGMTDLLLEP